MLSICRRFEFHAAHHLPDHEGKCQQIHGHSYVLDTEIIGKIQPEGSMKGMIYDFGRLKEIVNKEVINKLDHTDLNSKWENPTAENMVVDIVNWIQLALPIGINLVRLSLWETRTSCAIWRRYENL